VHIGTGRRGSLHRLSEPVARALVEGAVDKDGRCCAAVDGCGCLLERRRRAGASEWRT
jgi:hypothetical protein